MFQFTNNQINWLLFFEAMSARLTLVILSLVLSVLIGWRLGVRNEGRNEGKARQGVVIGLSMDTLKEERWQLDRDYFVAKARELGAEVLVQSANSDDVRQINDVEALISRGVDALVIVPHNGEVMSRGVKLAHDAGIPVLSYDRLITKSNVDLYLSFDNVRVGELQAEFLKKRIPAGGKLRVVRIYGSKSDNNAFMFKQGQDLVLEPLIAEGKVEVVHEDWATDWKPEEAKKIVNAAIAAKGANFDVVLASNDGTAGGAIQALLEEGLAGKVLVTGQDADLAACQRIAKGTQSMTIYKPLKLLAEKGAELAVKLAKRQPIVARDEIDNGAVKVPSVFLEVKVVTKENLEDTVIADGLHRKEAVFR